MVACGRDIWKDTNRSENIEVSVSDEFMLSREIVFTSLLEDASKSLPSAMLPSLVLYESINPAFFVHPTME